VLQTADSARQTDETFAPVGRMQITQLWPCWLGGRMMSAVVTAATLAPLPLWLIRQVA